jgi:hypothetical protein
MMDEPNDRFAERLREAVRDYHQPPPTPRDAMWTRIASERRRRREARRLMVTPTWLAWGVGIAAVLALGVGIGRWSARERPAPPWAGPAAGDAALAYHLAATQHFSRTETFLTDFRGAGLDPRFALSARELLTQTRLMLDSPAADDARLRALLEELELVLAQIAQAAAGDSAERNLIAQGLEQRGVLPRLRTAIPAGPGLSTQGAL